MNERQIHDVRLGILYKLSQFGTEEALAVLGMIVSGLIHSIPMEDRSAAMAGWITLLIETERDQNRLEDEKGSMH
jgi:hypothetical protein